MSDRKQPTEYRPLLEGMTDRECAELCAELSHDLVEILQKIRDHFGKAVNINSAYRTPAKNKQVGGAAYSQHLYGMAADISITPMGNSYEFTVTQSDGSSNCLMTIYVFTGLQREEQAVSDNRFVLHRTESTVYAAHLEVVSAAYGITQESMKNAFHMIVQDWKVGET